MQKQPSYKKWCGLKSLGEKKCKIKGCGQEMASNILFFIQAFKGCTIFYSLAVFAFLFVWHKAPNASL